jgi:pyrophosphatase PpaX
MNKKINTILFDLDGTLIDTNELIIRSFLHTFSIYNPGQFARNDVLRFLGPTLVETFTEVGPTRVEDMIATYRAYNKEQHDGLVQAFEGVQETLQQLHDEGYKLGIVSTKKRDMVLRGLELTKIRHYFDPVISLDEVTNAKPDPEPVQKALVLMQSTPEESMMIGDNHHDIVAGQRAGTMTVGVAWSAKGKEYLLDFNPDYIIDQMSDLLKVLKGINK